MSLPLKALALGLVAASALAGTANAQSAGAPHAQTVAWRGGWHGGWRGGWWGPAAVGGAIVGGALAAATSPFYGYYGPGYAYDYGPGYAYEPAYGSGYAYGPGYGAYGSAVAPAGGDVAYCEQRFRSYDPASGTYLGYDGIRHSCP
jgi:hypothetical protein